MTPVHVARRLVPGSLSRGSTGSSFLATRPVQLPLALLIALFASTWIGALVISSASPPADNIEQILWVQSLQWGYYKHPPIPTWLFWIVVQLFGRTVGASYLAAVLTNFASLAVFWHLMRRLRGQHFATTALLAGLCITYYNLRFTTYNHNTVLMLVSTASAALCWQACTTRKMAWWIGLGVMLGIGLLTKYQIAVTMASVLAFWLHQKGWKSAALRRGLLVACLIALVLFVPHLQWLRRHDFGPVGYAIESSLGAGLSLPSRLIDALNWLGDQCLNRALPAWILLASILVRHRRLAMVQTDASLKVALPRPTHHADSTHAFLMCWGLVPLVFMPLVGLLAGSQLHRPWGTPFLLFAVPVVMDLLRSRIRWDSIPLAHVAVPFMIIQTAMLLLSIATSPVGPTRLHDHHWRSFDSISMARQIEPALHTALAGKAIAAIDGPQLLAGVLALQLPGQPAVLIDGSLDRSPWLSAATLASGPTLHIHSGSPRAGDQAVGTAYPDIFWKLTWPVSVPLHTTAYNRATPARMQ